MKRHVCGGERDQETASGSTWNRKWPWTWDKTHPVGAVSGPGCVSHTEHENNNMSSMTLITSRASAHIGSIVDATTTEVATTLAAATAANTSSADEGTSPIPLIPYWNLMALLFVATMSSWSMQRLSIHTGKKRMTVRSGFRMITSGPTPPHKQQFGPACGRV